MGLVNPLADLDIFDVDGLGFGDLADVLDITEGAVTKEVTEADRGSTMATEADVTEAESRRNQIEI